jgi:hypothetical protein
MKFLIKKVNSKNIIVDYNSVALSYIISFMLLSSCTDLSIEPGQSNSLDSKINILTPAANGILHIGENEIIYSLNQPYSIKFIELYVNDVFVKNIPPGSNGNAPQINLVLDSTAMGEMLSLFLIYYDTDETSSKSNVVRDVLITDDLIAPFKPYNLALIKFNDGSCNISWKDSSHYVEKYELWKKIDFTDEYSQYLELNGNAFNVNDYDLDSNKIYFYKVRGVKNSGSSEFSDEINTAGIIASGNLYPPTNLIANVQDNSAIKLSWKDNSDNENYFSVERSTNNISFTTISNLPANSISYLDLSNTLTTGLTYYYRIKAFSNSDSAISNTTQITLAVNYLIAPSNLEAIYNSSIGVIELSWINNDNNVVYIEIERKNETNEYSVIRRANGNINLFLDFGIFANQTYTYRIRGYNLNTNSEYSNEVTISTY